MGEDRGEHISLINLLYWFLSEKLFHAKGRVKEDGVFKFYEQESCQRGTSYHARRTTHDARCTMHDARPATQDPRRTTHPPTPISQSRLPSIISNVVNNKNELWKAVRLASFQKPKFQSLSIVFKFVHPWLLLYLLCRLLFLLLTFWAIFSY